MGSAVTRRKFSETDVLRTIQIELFRRAIGLICLRCGDPLFEAVYETPSHGQTPNPIDAIPTDKIEREHYIELAIGGEDAPANCMYSHATCHKAVTNGTKATSAGSSKHKIAKEKRILAGGRRRKGPAMKSKPFSKVKRPFQKRKK